MPNLETEKKQHPDAEFVDIIDPPKGLFFKLPGLRHSLLLKEPASISSAYLEETPSRAKPYVGDEFLAGVISSAGQPSLISEMRAVRKELSEIKEILRSLTVLSVQSPSELRQISKKDALKEIKELFAQSLGSLFYDEIAESLNLPLTQVVEVCNILEGEGVIGEKDKGKTG